MRVPELPPGRIGIAWCDDGAADPTAEAFIEHATALTGGHLM
ncbi:hypothetical protein [Nocardia sp. NPDC046763]